MDSLDYKIISSLVDNGRSTWSELASNLQMSAPAIADRVRRLEEQGIIKGYSALLDSETLGYGMTAFISISIDRMEHRALFLAKVAELAEVQECHHAAGEDDYLLKVRCRGTKDLDRIISEELRQLPGVFKTRTTIILSTVKETHNIPLTESD
ncbi:Lrp/AsnC family transcriptional regulator [Domibacillus enclensis]|uniref:AsnC family transcriptional regulator n=1 Tax=Domibacillus enclensis TaxID=1017273 RepID=A0A1N6ND81_9BACI|nr:Lrp/AsnC family transcriptional regulator [Domibacillus enclensis]OXS80010.1 AsnC family transcriptional regulator [Domibacillus enclensis]SIP90044.1 Lrp/AsnC family transcriptional regulator, leucine-responsive regulatory protein [Domibacillus enclensis]